jgi:hypothetical protein
MDETCSMYTESGKYIQNLSRKIKGKDHLDLDVDGRIYGPRGRRSGQDTSGSG